MHLYIIIPAHNRLKYTRDCLRCLTKQTYRDFTVVVVDDGSTDGTSQMIRSEFDGVIIIKGTGDLWWTGATNEGIRYALNYAQDDDAVVLMNDDLLFPDDCLERLVNAAVKHPKALIGCVEADADCPDLIDNGGNLTNWWTGHTRILNRGAPLRSFQEGHYEEVSTFHGRGLLIRCEVFRTIGLYDEQHFRQAGDLELTVRANRQGYQLLMSYDAVVWTFPQSPEGNLNYKNAYYIHDIRPYFFGIKSAGNLRVLFWFAFLTRKSIVQFVIHYLCRVVKITGRFIIRFRLRPRDERLSPSVND